MASLSSVPTDDVTKEIDVGITEYVSIEKRSFRGLLKKRYTDFLVNEVQPDGTVVHLQNLRAGKYHVQAKAEHSWAAPQDIPVEDISALLVSLSEKTTEEILALYNKILSNPDARPKDHGYIECPIPEDKQVRTTIHNDIRRIFSSRIESSADKDRNLLIFSAALPVRQNAPSWKSNTYGQPKRQGKLGWADRGGEYLHFTLFKENKDTMECISFITKQLNQNPRSFQFAGTKDRRAVTVQRVSAYRIEDNRLAGLNRMLRNSSVGDFTYHQHGLQLGDLKGNEFVITLRDCEWESHNGTTAEKIMSAEATVRTACQNLQEQGFLNYFGLQRFGTFATGTHTVGIKILQEDFKGACDAILDYPPHILTAELENPRDRIGADDKARAHAIHTFRETGSSQTALMDLPRKFSGESNLIRHLSRSPTDHSGAIQMIPRNLKLMYVHAYQALVWNYVASERWRRHGTTVVEGDLVLINEPVDADSPAVPQTDADGEVIVQPSGAERAKPVDDMFQRARRLDATEADSGRFTIFDIVLPLPGYDVEYPGAGMQDFYQSFMASEQGGGLDPFDMRRKQRDFSLSGSYRKILARIGEGWGANVLAYTEDDRQFVQTDLEILRGGKIDPAKAQTAADEQADEDPQLNTTGGEAGDKGEKLAVVLKMQLGSSQYATMALRELSRSGVKAYKPDFGGR